MKSKLCLYALVALLLIGISGCKKVEQTELNIDSCQYKATIQGIVLYPAGITLNNQESVPASDVNVFVDVPYSYYSATASGIKRFETTTDSQGKFSIDIPVTVNSAQITIRVPSFQGKHYVFEQFVQEGGNFIPKFVQKEVLYSFLGKNATANASNIIHENLLLTYNLIGVEPEYKYTAIYQFNVEKEFYQVPSGPPYTIPTLEWVPQENKDVVVEVTRGNEKNYYIGRSNAAGFVSIDIPIKELSENVQITVKSNPYRGTITFYEISGDLQTYSTVVKNGIYLPSGFTHYSYLSALKPVMEQNSVQFYFTED